MKFKRGHAIIMGLLLFWKCDPEVRLSKSTCHWHHILPQLEFFLLLVHEELRFFSTLSASVMMVLCENHRSSFFFFVCLHGHAGIGAHIGTSLLVIALVQKRPQFPICLEDKWNVSCEGGLLHLVTFVFFNPLVFYRGWKH